MNGAHQDARNAKFLDRDVLCLWRLDTVAVKFILKWILLYFIAGPGYRRGRRVPRGRDAREQYRENTGHEDAVEGPGTPNRGNRGT